MRSAPRSPDGCAEPENRIGSCSEATLSGEPEVSLWSRNGDQVAAPGLTEQVSRAKLRRCDDLGEVPISRIMR